MYILHATSEEGDVIKQYYHKMNAYQLHIHLACMYVCMYVCTHTYEHTFIHHHHHSPCLFLSCDLENASTPYAVL